jgi:hypothetical protein
MDVDVLQNKNFENCPMQGRGIVAAGPGATPDSVWTPVYGPA